jgi:hypothetical protein
MKLKTTVTPILDSQTFEFQTYEDSDERLIIQTNLDTAFTASVDYIEYYIYNPNNVLVYPSTTVPLEQYNIKEGDVLLDPELNLETRGFDIGTYQISYNFYRKQLSSNVTEKYFISEISSDRTEIRLDSNVIVNELIISSSNSFIQTRENSEYFVDFYLNFGNNKTVIANNIQLDIDEGIDPTLLIKLYEPLPSNFGLKDELWVVTELSAPQAYKVVFPFDPIIEDDFTYLAGPNYSLNIAQQTGTPSEPFSYSTLLNSDITSSINQIQSLLNEKEININIDYENYGNFINFSSAQTRLENFYYKVGLIQSASNNLENFYGQVSSGTVNQQFFSASTATLKNQINDIIKNFDGYEYFLYFNSGSLYSYPKSNTEPPFQLYATGSAQVLTWLGSANPNSTEYGGQALSASNYDENNRDWLYFSIPEYLRDDSANKKYELFVDMVGQYYDNVWTYTKDITNKFDADNRLDYGISKDLVADAIRDFSVKLYSNNFNTDDLFTAFLGLTPSGSAFPFPTMTGSLPTPSGYEYVDTKISASNDIVPLNDVNKRLYKRIYHNIPYLLKTKGTVAGIRALITAYGIPDTILRINEFGGKDRNEAQDYDLKQNVFNYAFDTGVNAINFVSSSLKINTKFGIPADQNPQTIQLRFKTAGIPTASSNVASSDIRYSQSLWFTNDGGNLVLEYTGSGLISGSYSGSTINPYDYYGTLKWVPAQDDNPSLSASAYLPFFDGGWWSAQINMPIENNGGPVNLTASLFAANQINGKIGFSASDSTSGYDSSYYSSAIVANLNDNSNYVFTDGTIYEPFSGSFQELRYWSASLNEDVFFDYVVNPYSIEGNTINNTPDSLIFRADLGTQLDTASRTSIHPRVTGSAVQITQSFTSDSSYFIPNNRGLFTTNVEDIFQDQVVAGMKNRITEKIILKSSSLAEAPYGYNENSPDSTGDILPTQGRITASILSPMRSLQQNSFTSQSYTPNVDYLEVAFSPANQINDDINAQLGYFNIGDYIGDPRFVSSSDYSYPDLNRLRDAYFEKYIDSYDIVDFIRLIKFFDNSLFKMIKDFTPARTSLASGVVVKQHLLERNRQRPPQVSSSNETLEALVVNLPKDYSSGSLDYPQYSTSGSAIYKFTGGAGGSVNKWNGLQTYQLTSTHILAGTELINNVTSDTINWPGSSFTYANVSASAVTAKNGTVDVMLGPARGSVTVREAIEKLPFQTSSSLTEFRVGDTIIANGSDFSASLTGQIVITVDTNILEQLIFPSNRFNITQSYNIVGTERSPNEYSVINSTYFNYSSSQFLSASYQGRGFEEITSQHEFYDGEFSGSKIVATTQSLNPGCSPYLNVVDKGARYNPLFFNGEINYSEQGTVSLKTFNNPNNEPIDGFAWIYSQKITNQQLLAETGADSNYNYVFSIKLSRRDLDGNDVTDYLEIGTEIEVNMPSAPTFGGGIPTYLIQGIIPEANSVRLRIAIEKGDNKASDPIIVSENLLYSRENISNPAVGDIYFRDSQSSANFIDPYSLENIIIPAYSENNIDSQAYFASASIASGSGEGTLEVSYKSRTAGNVSILYNYSGAAQISSNGTSSQYRFNVDGSTVLINPITGELPSVGTLLDINLRTQGESFFPITSSANGGSENWSLVVETTYTSSDSNRNDSDLQQQNVFKSDTSLNQTEFVVVYSTPQSASLQFPKYNSPTTNSVGGENPWYGPQGLIGAPGPLNLGAPNQLMGSVPSEAGVFGRTLAQGMLNAENNNAYLQFEATGEDILVSSGSGGTRKAKITKDPFRYSSYNLYRTPNVPLNFSMSFFYSASSLGDGSSQTALTSSGGVHNGQGYNPNNAGNTSQALTLTATGSGAVGLSARTFFVETGSGHTTLTAAINAFPLLPSSSFGQVFSEGLFFAAQISVQSQAGTTLKSNAQLTTNWDKFDVGLSNAFSMKYYPLKNVEDNTLAGVGRIGRNGGLIPITEVPYDTSDPKFNALYRADGTYITKLTGSNAVSGGGTNEVLSGIFTPPTQFEGVSPPVFAEELNNLIPGNSGSVEYNQSLLTASLLTRPAGHPKIAINGSASLSYNFGKFQFAGTPTTTPIKTMTPLSGSALQAGNSTWNPTTGNLYWQASASTGDGAYSIGEVNGSYRWDEWTSLARNNATDSGNFNFLSSLQPYYDFEIFCYVPTGVTFNATASVQHSTGSDYRIATQECYPLVQANGASFNITNPSTGQTESVQLYKIQLIFGISNEQIVRNRVVTDGPFRTRLAIESSIDFSYYVDEWDVRAVIMRYQKDDSVNGSFDGTSYAFTGDGTITGTGLGASNDLQIFQTANSNAIQSGSVHVSALLKYTGSVYDTATSNTASVDIVLTSSLSQSYDIYPGAVIDIENSASNAVGTFSNFTPYNSTSNTSSTLNLAGGMYYMQYSMSNYSASFTENYDFQFIADSNQGITATQTLLQGTVSTANPTASIYPQIYLGNTSDRTTFGEIVQFESGEVPFTRAANTSSTGYYSFSGSFIPIGEDGWQLNDSLRMAFNVQREGSNIGITIVSSSLGISPGQSIYSPLTASVNPNVFRVPTITQFSIPTFYQNGVLPFRLALDCQPLLNNYNASRKSVHIMDVDYSNESGPIIPVNQNQILENTAIRAAVPDSNYSSQAWTIPRYTGSRSICSQYNVFTYGDIGTYGQLPNIESRLAYFAYFESIVNPYPLYNNATQLNVAYLIDEQENALPPSLGGQSYEIMNTLYPPESEVSVQVNSGSNILQELNGTQNIKSVGQRYEPISFSQTSSNGYATNIPLSGSGRISVYDNVGSAAAKTFYAMSIMGGGVTDPSDIANLIGSSHIDGVSAATSEFYKLRPTASIVTASYNNTDGTPLPPLAVYSNGLFCFTSSVDNVAGQPLKNPQTIYGETTFVTSFLYESDTDEMRIMLGCKRLPGGGGSNNFTDFNLVDIELTAYYLGQSRYCGSVLGALENGGGWRSGIMVKFITPSGGESTTVQQDSSKRYNMLFEDPVIKALLLNRGVQWKKHGGVENGGPVEYLEWKITYNTEGRDFNAGDKIQFQLFGNMTKTGGNRSYLNVFYPQGYEARQGEKYYLPTNFTVIGAYDSSDGDNSASAPYWEFSGSELDHIEMASPNFNEAYGSGFTQGYLPYEAGNSQYFEGGFEPTNTKFPRITKPLQFKVNDEIRFLNNELYNYTVTAVTPPEENIDSTGQGKVKLKLNKPVNGAIDKNFFLVRRPTDDASIAYLNLDYPYDADITNVNLSSSEYSSAGLILPTFPSEFINVSASQIVNNLISKGIIKS